MSLSSASQPSSFMQRVSSRIARAQFLSVSILLHALLVVFAGGIVLVRHYQEKPDFVAGDGTLVNVASTQETPPAAPDMPTAPAMPAMAAPAMPAITTTAVSPTTAFAVDTTAAMPSLSKGTMTGLEHALTAPGVGTGAAAGGGRGTGFFGQQADKPKAALMGTFYDLKQTPGRKASGVSVGDYQKLFRKFEHEGWHESILNKYYKAPHPMYATQVFIPNMPADEGPKAFGVEKEVEPGRWLVLYKARVSPPQDGTYHFVGAGDDVMLVRFNNKTVLDRCWFQDDSPWKPEANYNYGFSGIRNGFAKGDAIKVQAGQSYDIEILIGEEPGGLMYSCLLIEQDGATYQKDRSGNPILPVFRVAGEPMPELQKGQTLPPYDPNGQAWKVTLKTSSFESLLPQGGM